jgi:hypothetical protein
MNSQTPKIRVRYVAIYKIHGANKLPGGAESAALLTLTNPSISATLTINPEPHFLHINKSAALANQLLKGIFAPDKEGTPEERLAAEVEAVKTQTAKEAGTGVFLVLEGQTEIDSPDFKHRRDLDDCAINLDGVDKSEIREAFRPAVQSVLTALSLHQARADPRVQKIGDVIYLVDPNTGKPIYTYEFQMGAARLSLASPLTQDAITAAAAMVLKLNADSTIARAAGLLITSLEQATDQLQAFIAAWSALEIFVNATFKATYEARWFQIMEDGAPASAKPVFKRFEDVMTDKYRLADKFLIIASVLDSQAATDDAKEFVRLKKFRDGLFHALDSPTSSLPTDDVQKLLLKFMKLHFTAKA